jgi:hypothetical protein
LQSGGQKQVPDTSGIPEGTTPRSVEDLPKKTVSTSLSDQASERKFQERERIETADALRRSREDQQRWAADKDKALALEDLRDRNMQRRAKVAQEAMAERNLNGLSAAYIASGMSPEDARKKAGETIVAMDQQKLQGFQDRHQKIQDGIQVAHVRLGLEEKRLEQTERRNDIYARSVQFKEQAEALKARVREANESLSREDGRITALMTRRAMVAENRSGKEPAAVKGELDIIDKQIESSFVAYQNAQEAMDNVVNQMHDLARDSQLPSATPKKSDIPQKGGITVNGTAVPVGGTITIAGGKSYKLSRVVNGKPRWVPAQ